MRSWVKLQFILGLMVGSVALSARAQAEAPSAAATAAATAPDVVRLKNGGMLRGTIAESEPGQSVTIVLLTGETRKISAADVSYAGPASAAPGAAPPAPAAAAPAAPPAAPAAPSGNGNVQPFAVVHATEARVDFVSEPAGNSLFRRSSTASFINNNGNIPIAAGYEEVCTAPCNASMPSGTHTFAVAQSGGSPIEADPIALPPGNSTLKGTYHDNLGTRVAVIVVGVAAVAGGLALELSSFGSGENGFNTTSLVGGTALEVGGLVAILCARLARDTVDLSITPGVGAPAASLAPLQAGNARNSSARFMDDPRARAAPLRDGFSGLTLTARF